MAVKRIEYQNYEKPSDYWSIPEGDSKIRVVSDGFMFTEYGINTSTGWKPIEASIAKKKGLEGKLRYAWIVFVYESKKVKILSKGPMLGDSIAKIGKKNGDPINYDLIVTRIGSGKNSKYSVRKSDNPDMDIVKNEKIIKLKDNLINKYFSD